MVGLEDDKWHAALHPLCMMSPLLILSKGTTQRFTFRLREDFPLAVKSAHWSTSVCVQMSKVSRFVKFAEVLIGQQMDLPGQDGSLKLWK